MKYKICLLIAFFFCSFSCSQKQQFSLGKSYPIKGRKYKNVSSLEKKLQKHHYSAVNELSVGASKLVPLHKAFDPGGLDDWYANHPEKGETFSQYVKSNPIKARPNRRTIYIQLLGKFSKGQSKIIDLSVEYIKLYYKLPVKLSPKLGLNVIPKHSRRIHWGTEQINARYILYKLLRPKKPKDAITYIAFTASDLYPQDDWNFVYGLASWKSQVGVWSLHRNGEADTTAKEFRDCLLRTIGTAVHEIGHTFGMPHCVAFDCVMNGANNMQEADRHPLWLCPVCLQKMQWNFKFDAKKRYQGLAKFYKKMGLEQERKFMLKSIQALEKK